MIKLCGSLTGIAAGQDRWGRRESNPHWLEPKSSASACWATAPVLLAQRSPGLGQASHDVWVVLG